MLRVRSPEELHAWPPPSPRQHGNRRAACVGGWAHPMCLGRHLSFLGAVALLGCSCASPGDAGSITRPHYQNASTLSANAEALLPLEDVNGDAISEFATLERLRQQPTSSLFSRVSIRDGSSLEALAHYDLDMGWLSGHAAFGLWEGKPVVAVGVELREGSGCRAKSVSYELRLLDMKGECVLRWDGAQIQSLSSLDYSKTIRPGGAWLLGGRFSPSEGEAVGNGVILVAGQAAGVEQLFVSRGPVVTCSAGDVNRDGVADVGVLELRNPLPASSQVLLLDGVSGRPLWRMTVTAGQTSRIRRVGDLSGDGVDDLAVCWPSAPINHGLQRHAGVVTAVSASEGDVLWSRLGDATAVLFGWSVEPIADHDGDGVADLLCGAPGSFFGPDDSPHGNRSYAAVLSGRTGAELLRLHPRDGGKGFGVSCATLPSGAGEIGVLVSTFLQINPERGVIERRAFTKM